MSRRMPNRGIAVSIAAIVVTLLLTAYQRRAIAATGSVAIKTDRLHYQSDLLLNAAVIAALVSDQYLAPQRCRSRCSASPSPRGCYGGAWRGASEAIAQLMDREWPDEKRRAFVEVAAREPGLESLHDLRTRTSGSQDFAQFHIALPGTTSVSDAHALVENLEARLEAAFPGTEILIHVDPAGHVDHPGNALRETDEIEQLKA
jgi:ferrous-iron efflux pump FieF